MESLEWDRLTGKTKRGHPLQEGRAKLGAAGGPPVEDEYLYGVVDALEAIAQETNKTIPQVAINWLLGHPTVMNVVIGARNEEQLKQNLGAVGWSLSTDSQT